MAGVAVTGGSTAPFAEMTWGAVLLAVAGLAAVFLVVSAPVIWWPRLRQAAQ